MMENTERIGQLVTLEEMLHLHEMRCFMLLEQLYIPFSVGDINLDKLKKMTLLSRHIMAEQLLLSESCLDEFKELARNKQTNLILQIVYLWMNPLKWIDEQRMKDVVVFLGAAKEDYEESRKQQVAEILEGINDILLSLPDDSVDNSLFTHYEMPIEKRVKNSAKTLTGNFKLLCNQILNGEKTNADDIKENGFNIEGLRENISFITKKLGEKQAALYLRTLQDQWESIKPFKITIQEKSKEAKELKHFEEALFNDFDDLLQKHPRRKYCVYINKNAVTLGGEFSLDEFEDLFHRAAQGTAPALVSFLVKYKKERYINLLGHRQREIYDNLKAHFGDIISYKYKNFSAAYKNGKLDS